MKKYMFSQSKFNAKLMLLVLSVLIFNSNNTFAIDSTLKLQYTFANSLADNVTADAGAFSATLMNGAQIVQMGNYNVLDLGQNNGYLDLKANTGSLINSLTGDYTIGLYVCVDESVSVTVAGNFIWTFANSDDMSATANGNMFFSAITNRFAISTTNWTGETSVKQGSALEKGSWQNVVYTQSGNTGTVYINGVLVKSGNVGLRPSDLGTTAYNYLGKSCYVGDAYLLKSKIYDFRIYNRALTANEITTFATQKAALDSALITQQVTDAKTELTLNGLNAVISDLTLPATVGSSVSVTWSSSNQAIISNSGVVTRPANGADTATVVLTATLSKNGISLSKTFTATVIPFLSDYQSARLDSTNLQLEGNLKLLRTNLTLPTSGVEGSVITWISEYPLVLSNSGIIVNRPAHGTGNKTVLLTASITKGNSVLTKQFEIIVAEDEGFSAYLFAYFTGNSGDQESIRFATSTDGYTYRALNNNQPILSSAAISSTGGVRDPHILRGENSDYYMVVTDMVSALGWNSNRAMVLLKSTNLTDWQSTVINIPNTYPQYSAADRVWAPQTIFDPTVGKYMVYFAMRLGSTDYDKIYYAYANSTFTGLESAPQLLFQNNGFATIDADIVLKDGVYNLFFKTEGNGNGIKKAVSASLTGGYVLYDKYLQSTTNAVEGGCVFRMYNSDNWILMYDMYTSGAYQFTTSTDLVNFSVANTPISFDFTPRHGTIIPITSSELSTLKAKWLQSRINEKTNSPQLTIYPNPASNYLNVDWGKSNSHNSKFAIYDFKGTKICENNITADAMKIDISNLNSGIYLLSLISENKRLSNVKFIVK